MKQIYNKGRFMRAVLLVLPLLAASWQIRGEINYKYYTQWQKKALKDIRDVQICSNVHDYMTDYKSVPLRPEGSAVDKFLDSAAGAKALFYFDAGAAFMVDYPQQQAFEIANICLFTGLIFKKIENVLDPKFRPFFFINVVDAGGLFYSATNESMNKDYQCKNIPLKFENSDTLWLGNNNFSHFVFCANKQKKTFTFSPSNPTQQPPTYPKIMLNTTELVAAMTIAQPSRYEFALENKALTLGGVFAICIDYLMRNGKSKPKKELSKIDETTNLKEFLNAVKIYYSPNENKFIEGVEVRFNKDVVDALQYFIGQIK